MRKTTPKYEYLSCKSDSAEEKRAELAVHTKLSDDISTISVNDAFQFALRCKHRAIAFTNFNNLQDFPEIARLARKHPEIKVIYGARLLYEGSDLSPAVMTLFIKNQKGVKNLFKIVSAQSGAAASKYVSFAEIEKYGKNLLCGASGEQSELFYAIKSELSDEKISAVAKKYDFFEICPTDDPDKRRIYTKIYELGKKLGIPTVATGNCHYCFKGDELGRRIAAPDAEDNGLLYFRSTAEMLDEFSYLGESAAYETVVKNTNLIADSVTAVEPIPTRFKQFHIPGADAELLFLAEETAAELYGKDMPEIVKERLYRELNSIINNDFAAIYTLARLVCEQLHEKGIPTSLRGSAGSSFVAFLLGITEINPLPPHYYCNVCKYTEFANGVYSGFDLEEKFCPVCGKKLVGEGHGIPFESFAGYLGSKLPDFDITVPSSAHSSAFEIINRIFNENRVLRAGTVSSITSCDAEVLISQYEKENGERLSRQYAAYVTEQIIGIKKGEGLHPGAVFILPHNSEFCDFTPTRASENDPVKHSSHFDFHGICDTLYKADILGAPALDLLLRLQNKTGVCAKDLPLCDPEVIKIFTDADTEAIPNFSNELVRNMLLKTKPESFGELVKVCGFAHGTNVWVDNGEHLIGRLPLSAIPALRDDIFNDLVSSGADPTDSFLMCESVRKGLLSRGRVRDEYLSVFKEISAPLGDWYFDFCSKVRYSFPKAHAIEYVITALRLAWFRKYYPHEYFDAYLSCFFENPDDLSPKERAEYENVLKLSKSET